MSISELLVHTDYIVEVLDNQMIRSSPETRGIAEGGGSSWPEISDATYLSPSLPRFSIGSSSSMELSQLTLSKVLNFSGKHNCVRRIIGSTILSYDKMWERATLLGGMSQDLSEHFKVCASPSCRLLAEFHVVSNSPSLVPAKNYYWLW